MRKMFVFLFAGMLSIKAFAQKDSLKRQPSIMSSFDIDSTDIYRIYSLLGVDVSKFYLSKKYAPYYCNLIIEEYTLGEKTVLISLRDSISKTFHHSFYVEDNLNSKELFEVLFYSQRLDSAIKIQSNIGGMAFTKRLKLKPSISYSWKEVYNLENSKHVPEINKVFPLLVYSQPVAKRFNNIEGASEFCKISGEKVDPKDWYNELGIEHFFLFSIRLEK